MNKEKIKDLIKDEIKEFFLDCYKDYKEDYFARGTIKEKIHEIIKEVVLEKMGEAIENTYYNLSKFHRSVSNEYEKVLKVCFEKVLFEEIKLKVEREYNSEIFIDKIIERINKKQIKGG